MGQEEEETEEFRYADLLAPVVKAIPKARSAGKAQALSPPLPMGKPAQAVPYAMRVFIYDDVAPALNHNLQVRASSSPGPCAWVSEELCLSGTHAHTHRAGASAPACQCTFGALAR